MEINIILTKFRDIESQCLMNIRYKPDPFIITVNQTVPNSQGKLEKKLKQIPYQNIFVLRSCIRTGLATQNLFTLDIHRRIFNRIKSKMADYLTKIT